MRKLLSALLLMGMAWALAMPPAAAASLNGTAILEVHLEPRENAIYLPFEGSRPPLATISSQGKSLVIDVPRTGFPFAEWYDQIERSPLLRALVAAYDPEIKGLHLVIEGHVPLTAEPDLSYPGKGLRFVILPRDPRLIASLARPQSVTQRISFVPRDGSPTRTLSIGAVARRLELPSLRLGFSTGPTTEQYSPQGLAGGAEGVGRFQARWEPSYGEYSLPVRLARGGYRYADPDYAGVDHLRAETRLDLAVARTYALGPVKADSGLGYRAELTQVQSSARSAAPTFFFAGYQAMHGPSLRQTFSGTTWGPLGLGLELDWSPLVFAHVAGGASMPWLTAFRVEPRLYLFPEERVSLGYFYERTVGATFNRESSGVSLGMSFSGF